MAHAHVKRLRAASKTRGGRRAAARLPLPGAASNFGARVRSVRLYLGMRQAEFAQSIGTSRSHLSKVETSARKPNIEVLKRIIGSFLDISAGWLMTGQEPMLVSELPAPERPTFRLHYAPMTGSPKVPLPGASESFGVRVKSVRTFFGMGQSQFADMVGVSQSYLSQVERGARPPSLAVLKGILSSFFGLRTGWLMTGEGEMFLVAPRDATVASLSLLRPPRSEAVRRPRRRKRSPLSG